MKKFLAIIVLSLLICSSSIAKEFYIVCDGKVTTTATMHKSTVNLFEEWKIVIVDKKIIFAELINTGHWNYRSGYLGNELNFANNVLNINAYNEKTKEGFVIEKYIHSISFNSGRFSWSQFLESSSNSYIFQAQGRCEGHRDILNYLN